MLVDISSAGGFCLQGFCWLAFFPRGFCNPIFTTIDDQAHYYLSAIGSMLKILVYNPAQLFCLVSGHLAKPLTIPMNIALVVHELELSKHAAELLTP